MATSSEIINAFVGTARGRNRNAAAGERAFDGDYVLVWGPSADIDAPKSWFFAVHRAPDGAVSMPEKVAQHVPGTVLRGPGFKRGRFTHWLPADPQRSGGDVVALLLDGLRLAGLEW